MSSKLEDALRDILRSGKDWERKATTIPGIFILKLPKYKGTPPRLVVELNPVDEYGKPSKRRGLIIRNSDDLKEYRDIINAEKLDRLLEIMDRVNPSGAKKGAEEALEI